jgi:hypothetical protein
MIHTGFEQKGLKPNTLCNLIHSDLELSSALPTVPCHENSVAFLFFFNGLSELVLHPVCLHAAADYRLIFSLVQMLVE